ncbi:MULTISPECIES: hypothetical protein [unclassified Moorena]|uniref:hypothetical protein n=1 Tax=unclassified Moorena TaxID=2683338 RepID=UPI0013C88913|nr:MULTISPECIES: hypothetical protein [unclassified Moorena]NES40054.1 hypothetical protein [Moorena sp. SIO2C4]
MGYSALLRIRNSLLLGWRNYCAGETDGLLGSVEDWQQLALGTDKTDKKDF